MARIEMKRSITPLVIKAVLLGACSAILGMITFLVFYYLPLRTVREAYDKLQASEERYRLIAEKMNDIVWIADIDLNTLYITPSVQTILGFSQEEVPKTIDQQITPDSLVIAMEAFSRELAIEKQGNGDPDRTASLVLEYYHKDGSTHWLETMMSWLRNDQGVLTGIHGVSRDITERKRAEDALRASEEKFSSAFRYSPNAICISTIREGCLVDVNDVFLDTLGYKREEIIGRTTADLNLWVDMDQRNIMLKALLETGKVTGFEFRIRDKQDKIHWGLGSMSLIKITEKPYILTQTVDVTERKLAEEKFYKVFITTPDGIVITRLIDGVFLEVNKGFEDIVGWKREEIIGLKSVESPVNFWVDLSERRFLVAELGAGRDVLHREIEFRQKDGSIHSGVYSARPISIAGEECLIFVLQDITGKKRMERELMAFQKMKLMGQITAGVAHEVRNPLHAIQAMSEAMDKAMSEAMSIGLNKNSDSQDYLMHIKAQVERLSHLMNDLLELGRPIRPSQFSRALLTEIAAVAVKRWEEAHPHPAPSVKVADRLPPDDFVLVDTNKIQRVIINLINNAAQHSPMDKEILLELSKSGEDCMMVRVIDRGEGLRPENQGRVFDPFYTTCKGSTGLGLSICRHIIESHGGKIEIINNKNAPGCTAWFTLPVQNSREQTGNRSYC